MSLGSLQGHTFAKVRPTLFTHLDRDGLRLVKELRPGRLDVRRRERGRQPRVVWSAQAQVERPSKHWKVSAVVEAGRIRHLTTREL